MPAATNKADLIAVTTAEFEKLKIQIDRVPDGLRLRKDDGGISPKDVIGHRAHWIDLFLGWYADGQAGKQVNFPADGYKWSQLTRYNARLRVAQADIGWLDACFLLETAHDRLMGWIATHSDQELYGGPMKGAKNAWTPGRWAESAGASHYRSAGKYLRARIRSHTQHAV